MSPFPTNEQQDTEPLSAQWQHLHDTYAELTQDKTPEVLEGYLAQYVSLKEACAVHALTLDETALTTRLMKELRALNVVIFMTPTAEKKVRQLAGLYRTVLAHFSLSPEDRAYLNGEMRSCAKALTLVKKAFFRGPLLHHSDETFEAIAHWENGECQVSFPLFLLKISRFAPQDIDQVGSRSAHPNRRQRALPSDTSYVRRHVARRMFSSATLASHY